MIRHVVADGECVLSVAAAHGVPWRTVWLHPDNAALRAQRKDPSVLLAGDVLAVPDRAVREESRATDRRHRFRVDTTAAHLKIRVLIDDRPLANAAYRLVIDGAPDRSGHTDDGGFVSEPISARARTGTLYVESRGIRLAYQLRLGGLDPIDTESGVRQRLAQLGFPSADDLPGAVKAFQAKAGLRPSGLIDDATRGQLSQSYGQ